MLQKLLLEETTVRESGERDLYDSGECRVQNLTLTLGITQAGEHETLDLQIYASTDGVNWLPDPVLSFTRKCWCGNYEMTANSILFQSLKAAWQVSRWGREERAPLFRFSLSAQMEPQKAMAGFA